MASKRMFSYQIVESGEFLEMPHSTQNLYFHLSMSADDDGFCNNAKIITRMTGCRPKDYQKLIENGYIIELSENLCVIKHWKINNNIRCDRYTPTIYQEALQMLDLKEKVYKRKDTNDEYQDGYQERNEDGYQERVKNSECVPQRGLERLDTDSSCVCAIYEEFCNKLSKAYPQSRFDKETAYSMWLKRTDEINSKDTQEASNKIGRAIWNYISEYKESHNEDGEVDYSYIPKLSNILGTQFDYLILPLIDKEV